MYFLICLWVATALPQGYHTTDEMVSLLDDLERGVCKGVLTKLKTQSVIAYDLIGSHQAAVNSFFLFGEHARELISPESGLRFIEKLCTDDEFAKVLLTSSIRIVLVANPHSRRKVEGGDYCLRTNEHGVDLNRNWDDHWVSEDCSYGSETCPGPHPFSEVESVEVKDLLHEFEADLFLTVHSGALTLLSSYAYAPGLPADGGKDHLKVLNELDESFCRCRVGSAAAILNYNCPGTCLDYALDVEGVAFSFAFEIYEEDENLTAHFSEGAFSSFLQKAPHSSCFMQTGVSKTNAECMTFFNPISSEYEFYVEHWAGAYKKLIELVSERIY
mmetsp:Transcript_19013/g.34563  ORF Transcript_19013/g.34563 Transcript_19013/m.34563 type:complete len:330 (-) Transcript_19013:2319-3308(-)